MLRPFTFCAAAFLLSIVPRAAYAQANWVGKTIIFKKADVELLGLDKQGKQVVLGKLDQASIVVLAEESGKVKVKNWRGIEGWIAKADAVPLEDAVNYFNDRIRDDRKDAFAYRRRACAWELNGKVDEAIKDLDSAIRLNPKDAAAYANRGGIWFSKSEFDKAIADYNAALRIDPTDAVAYHGRGT